jgi:hypothetical protein
MAVASPADVRVTTAGKVGLAVAALLLHGCGPPPPDPDCRSVLEPDASAPGLVNDPFVGARAGTLTWLETMETTPVTVTVSATGPVWSNYSPSGRAECGGYTVTLDVSVQTADGLIQSPPAPALSTAYVGTDGRVQVDSLDVTVDAGRLLDGGVAPEQPNLASQNPSADLSLSRENDGGLVSGLLRVAGPGASVTLATLAF